MFADVQHLQQLFDGAQEYNNKFRKNFHFGINTAITANPAQQYNPKNDFTLQKPGSYTDEFGEHLWVGRGANVAYYHPPPPFSSNDTIYALS
mmetsp:Transcript_13315/g.36810  ORF Transcript_13315/g.36810 Transcript_13315/m.36810 type:complete len:92 (+) Transcript_13315:109-384(+)